MRDYFCDFWLPKRSKCPASATVLATNGAPLRFCTKHWRARYRRDIEANYGPVSLDALT